MARKSIWRIALLSALALAPQAQADDPDWIPVDPPAPAPAASAAAVWASFDNLWAGLLTTRALASFYSTDPTGLAIFLR